MIVATVASSPAVERVRPPAASTRGGHAKDLRAFGRAIRTAPTTCSKNGTPSYVSPAAVSSFADGYATVVLGGFEETACEDYSAIVGGYENQIGNNGRAAESVIAGGQQNGITAIESFIGAGFFNSAQGSYSAIVGGVDNAATGFGSIVGSGGSLYLSEQNNDPKSPGNVASGADSFVGGGDLNSASGQGSFVGAGDSAYVSTGATTAGNQATGDDSFVGAGNQNVAASASSFVGAGQSNGVGGEGGFIGAGSLNRVTGAFGAIPGGLQNQAGGEYANIAGGSGNIASGTAASVPGGYHNLASGQFSFAAGFGSYATTDGSFVWSDDSGSSKHLAPNKANQFLARAAGGVTFYSNSGMTTGVTLAAGSGSWSNASDRDLKSRVSKLDDSAILSKVAALPVSEWSYTSEGAVRHVGPMAQDFYAAFNVGEDDKHIATIDEEGVALAAIKALHAENRDLRDSNVQLRARLARDEAQHVRDEIRFTRLEHRVETIAGVGVR
jgi:hypothetical protein